MKNNKNSQRSPVLRVVVKKKLKTRIEKTAERLGLSMSEFVRYSLINQLNNAFEATNFVDKRYKVSEGAELKIKDSMKNLRSGEFAILKDKESIQAHFSRLFSE